MVKKVNNWKNNVSILGIVILVILYIAAIIFWDEYRTPGWTYHHKRSTPLKIEKFITEDIIEKGHFAEYIRIVKHPVEVPVKWKDKKTGKIYTLEDEDKYIKEHNLLGATPLIVLIFFNIFLYKRFKKYIYNMIRGATGNSFYELDIATTITIIIVTLGFCTVLYIVWTLFIDPY